MKAIIVVLSPRESCDLLNGDLSVLVRKKFPKDYVGWVYIYVTKEKKTNKWAKRNVLCSDVHNGKPSGHYQLWLKDIDDGLHTILNGKVIARFWCDKVEEIERTVYGYYKTNTITWSKIEDKTCLRNKDLDIYFKAENHFGKVGYAIYITEAKPFDEPKEISEFMKTIYNFDGLDCWRCSKRHNCSFNRDKKCEKLKLTRAPRSGWCYVEV